MGQRTCREPGRNGGREYRPGRQLRRSLVEIPGAHGWTGGVACGLPAGVLDGYAPVVETSRIAHLQHTAWPEHRRENDNAEICPGADAVSEQQNESASALPANREKCSAQQGRHSRQEYDDEQQIE